MTEYVFGVGDQVVIRLDCTDSERWGKIVKVRARGEAEVLLPKMKGWPRESRVLLEPSGMSKLGAFRLIKLVTKAEFEATAGTSQGVIGNGLQRKS